MNSEREVELKVPSCRPQVPVCVRQGVWTGGAPGGGLSGDLHACAERTRRLQGKLCWISRAACHSEFQHGQKLVRHSLVWRSVHQALARQYSNQPLGSKSLSSGFCDHIRHANCRPLNASDERRRARSVCLSYGRKGSQRIIVSSLF